MKTEYKKRLSRWCIPKAVIMKDIHTGLYRGGKIFKKTRKIT